MAKFKEAYTRVQQFEGGYVNTPSDFGGETYAGISRRWNPKWGGWNYIDDRKHKTGANFPRGTKFPELDPDVESFYKALWDRLHLSDFASQKLADSLYDWVVNAGEDEIPEVVRSLQKAVGLPQDGILGTRTLMAVNAYRDPEFLNFLVFSERMQDHISAVATRPGQLANLKGWASRAVANL